MLHCRQCAGLDKDYMPIMVKEEDMEIEEDEESNEDSEDDDVEDELATVGEGEGGARRSRALPLGKGSFPRASFPL